MFSVYSRCFTAYSRTTSLTWKTFKLLVFLIILFNLKMVVCKFFLQGNCRFGENCKFEHQINDGRQQQQQHHSSVLRQQNFHTNPQATQINTGSTIDTNTLVRAVINDSTTAEKGGQWLLSCYAPFKEKPNFPGFEEQSFEEIRWGFYEAQRLGTVDQYKQQLQMSLQSAVMKLRSLQNPSPEAISTITSIYNSSPNASTMNNSASSNFNAAPPNTFANNQNPVFSNQSNSVFPQANNFSNANVYNQQQNPSAKSIFAAANQKLFTNTPPLQNSMFANNQAVSNGNFATPNIFNQQPSPFGQQQQQQSGIPGFVTAPQNGGFFNTPQNGTSPFNVQSQNAASAFNSQQQNGTLPFKQNQNELPFGVQQNDPHFNNQPQSNPPFFNTQQNAAAFNPQPSNNSPFNSFAIQQQNSIFTQQQQQPSNTPFIPVEDSQTNILFANGTNVFANNTQSLNSASHSSSIFGSTQTTVISNDYSKDESIYSKLKDLTEEDVKNYESDRFEFGKIPEKPPTIEMCF